MPKYISRKFVNGKWVYEYDQPRTGPVARKRVMTSANRMHSEINGVRKGYGAIASAAKKHERRVRESAGSAYRRDVDDSRGNGGGLRRMTQKENMRSLTRWRQQVAARRGQRLQKQGAETDSGHRTAPTIQKSGMKSLRKANPSILRKAIRGPKAAIERKRVHAEAKVHARDAGSNAAKSAERGAQMRKAAADRARTDALRNKGTIDRADAGNRTSGGAYSHRAHTNTAKSPSTARGRATERLIEKTMRTTRAHNESDGGYKKSIRNEKQAKTAIDVGNKKRADQWSRYKRHYNTAVRTGKEIITPRKRVQSRKSSRGRGTR